MSEKSIEVTISEDSTAMRVTLGDIEAVILSEHYFTAGEALQAIRGVSKDDGPLKLLTFCVLVLENGFTVTGESACASPENFNEEIGQHEARQNAINKIWPLLGYQLKDKLHRRQLGDAATARRLGALVELDLGSDKPLTGSSGCDDGTCEACQ